MGRKRVKFTPKPFETVGGKDVFANIYLSMIMSPAWRDLSATQQRLYLYLKMQLFAEHPKPKTEQYPGGHEEYFTFNKSKWCTLYGIYSGTNLGGFTRDRDALILHGFIKVVRDGQNTKTKTIYTYSAAWKTWGQPGFEISTKDMPLSLNRKYRRMKSDAIEAINDATNN